ncbi:sugar transporter [Ferrimonas balearica]|uniref:sugar transporter n=1 Tax=Ferrimonas balearica TaxID=44012 RepID=UPI001C590935|nr:sugar transporter [Ferrimonas balearica]MBW3164045.1 sugar transporter [Ferrimonas balearica]MBY6224027.1 sugar transporter [Ferrimonas balearica]
MLQRLTAWGPVILLALSAFVFNTSEFVPVGLLAALGESFNMTAVAIGPMLTVYAAVVALASLPAVLLFARFERRGLLLGLMGLFVASHVVTAWAPSYAILLSGRIGIALSHALFWAITPAMVVRLAPQGQGAKALGLLATGTVLALVLGIPLGRIVGQLLGWRITFALIGGVTLLLMLGLWRGLPRLPAERGGSWRSLPGLLRNRALMWLYGLTTVLVTAHYAVYTYLEPLLQQHFGYAPGVTTLMLLVFGGSGLAGSVLFGRYQARYARQLLALAVAVVGLCMGLLPLAGGQLWLLAGLCVVWGAAMMLMGLSLQAKGLKLAPDATDVAMAIYSGLFNVGIGSGALFGSILAARYGVIHNGPVAAGLILFAMVPLLGLFRARRQLPMDGAAA